MTTEGEAADALPKPPEFLALTEVTSCFRSQPSGKPGQHPSSCRRICHPRIAGGQSQQSRQPPRNPVALPQ